MNAEAKVSARIVSKDNTYRFFNLKLERSRVDSLVLNWTVVHPIDEDSPFYGLSQKEIVNPFESFILELKLIISTLVLPLKSIAFPIIPFGLLNKLVLKLPSQYKKNTTHLIIKNF
jgi:hypothetical protein